VAIKEMLEFSCSFALGIHTLPSEEKALIASIWLQNYNGGHEWNNN
jgi:hypothetical protein